VGLGLGEIGRLLGVLRQLVEAGNTVVLVEHDLDVIAAADWIVDLGPEAADEGGRIVVAGTPAEVMATAGSHTGRHLARHLESGGIDGSSRRPGRAPGARAG
jgi:excinuclease ABC subunit A